MLLANAGLDFEVVLPDVDEEAIRDAVTVDGDVDTSDLADILARAKGENVSARHPERLVIAADQILALGDRVFAKPNDSAAARDTLLALAGKTHQLHSAVVLARGGEIIWSDVDTAHLTMRALSAAEIGRYLAAVGDNVLSSVGAYQLEERGIQLFNSIEGNYFTILGLPLLPLLKELRARGVLSL